MSFCCSDENKKKLEQRLNRIEGQVRGINKMIADDRDCMEILNQVVSIQSALKGVWKEVVRSHLLGHIAKSLQENKHGEELVDELVEHLDKMK